MSSLLTSITHEIGNYVRWTESATATLFQIITFMGKFLLQTITFILETLCVGLFNLADGFCVFLQDFALFLRDVNDFLETLFKFFSNTGDQIVEGILSAFNSFQHFLTLVHMLAHAVLDNVLNLMMSILINAKLLVILVGNSTLFLLQLGPSLLMSVFCGIISLINSTVQTTLGYVGYIGNGIISFFKGVHLELADIPPSSLFGLLLALLISLVFRFYVLRYLKSIVQGRWSWTIFWRTVKNLVGKCWLLKQPSVLKATTRTSSSKCDTSVQLDDHSSRLLRQLEEEREEKLCVVCHDNFKCVILLPCRHFCLCETCMQVIEESDPSCPLCRRFVIDSIKVFT